MPALQLHDYMQRITTYINRIKKYTDEKALRCTNRCAERKAILLQRWHGLQGMERVFARICLAMAVIIAAQFIWILFLQYQLSQLSSVTEIQEIRIAHLEQSEKKHNSILYTTYSTIWDLQKQWNDLNFRVLENSWKLGNN